MKKTRRRGEKWERLFHAELKDSIPNLLPTTNSGATFGNGDLSSPKIILDVKSSEGKDFPKVSAENWKKMEKAALKLGKDFAFPLINGKREAGVFLPLYLAKRAFEALYGNHPRRDSLQLGAYQVGGSERDRLEAPWGSSFAD